MRPGRGAGSEESGGKCASKTKSQNPGERGSREDIDYSYLYEEERQTRLKKPAKTMVGETGSGIARARHTLRS